MKLTVTITLEAPDHYTANEACRDFERKQEAIERAIPGCRGSDVSALVDTKGILEAMRKSIIAQHGGQRAGEENHDQN